MNKYIDFPLFIKQGLKWYKVNTQDILYIEGDKDYLYIHTKAVKYHIHSTFKQMMVKLPRMKFMQVNRSFIVRLDAIHYISDGMQEIIMEKENKRIPIGTTYRKTLKDQLQTIEDEPKTQS